MCICGRAYFTGLQEQGVVNYLKTYTEPTIIMLPFNIISEFSRTLALAIRLFGNIMSGSMISGHSADHYAMSSFQLS